MRRGKLPMSSAVISEQLQSEVSAEIKQRLEWFDHYLKNGKNARLTCRHFGISPDTFYRWKRRYDPNNLSSLEDNKQNRRPKNLREPATPIEVVNKIRILRESHPRWSNNDILVQLKNEGAQISCSTIGRVIKRLEKTGLLRKAPTTARDTKKEKTVQNERPTGYSEYVSLLDLWNE